MTTQQFRYKLGNLRKTLNALAQQGIDVLFSVYLTIDGKKQKFIDQADYRQFKLIYNLVESNKPGKVLIEWFDKKDPRNILNLREFDLASPQKTPEKPAYIGFGEAEINQIVDQRMAERQRQMDHEELKDHVRDLTDENRQLQQRIEDLEQLNAHLDAELEKKKSIRYYAGMLGDILESFGIRRDKIKKPLAELMGIDEDQQPRQLSAESGDKSGIVEEAPTADDKKRMEIIDLIHQYLNTLPILSLSNVFRIFSAIEEDPFVGDELVEYLSNRQNHNP